MTPAKEEGPGCHSEAPQDLSTGSAFDSTAEAAVNGVFVAVVQTGIETVRRRVFLSLTPAQKAVQRARAAGINASLVIAELHAVEVP